MDATKWPTFEEALVLALLAKVAGLTIHLSQVDSGGWEWVWLHAESSTTLAGDCDCHYREVAIICALMSLPVIHIKTVDAESESTDK